MRRNRSYVFFRRLPESDAGPVGAAGAPLTSGRSLAVDTAYHMLGTPIYVVGESLNVHGERGFRRLMIAQDVGSAIKGPERGDIYWGSGKESERLAGETKHQGLFFVLLPRSAVR
jgi:membrane-bound lytic murein transglycosylase A